MDVVGIEGFYSTNLSPNVMAFWFPPGSDVSKTLSPSFHCCKFRHGCRRFYIRKSH